METEIIEAAEAVRHNYIRLVSLLENKVRQYPVLSTEHIGWNAVLISLYGLVHPLGDILDRIIGMAKR